VDVDNIKEYFAAGVRAVGASTSLFGRKALMEHNLEDIAQNVRKFIDLCLDWRK
jgi:2-keto-3-deoxy-6-phosphogluconate aldolase